MAPLKALGMFRQDTQKNLETGVLSPKILSALSRLSCGQWMRFILVAEDCLCAYYLISPSLPSFHPSFYRGQPGLRLNHIACKWKRQNLKPGPTFATRGCFSVPTGRAHLGARPNPWLFLVVRQWTCHLLSLGSASSHVRWEE